MKKDTKAIEAAWEDVRNALAIFAGMTGKIHVWIEGSDDEAVMMTYEIESMTENVGVLKINLL